MTTAERVANGAQLLDEKYPGWYRKINLDDLDIESACNCICGQLGEYEDKLWTDFAEENLGSPPDQVFSPNEVWMNWVINHGFVDDSGAMTKEWKLAILDRLNFDALDEEKVEKKEEVYA
jgi:hypothetical protein